jgi:hypothetical protein
MTATPTPTPAATATPGTPSSTDAVFVGPSPNDPASYQVSIVRSDGTVLASARADRRNDPGGLPTPVVSTSSTKVYYLDGTARVKSLTPEGKTWVETILPVQNQVHATFAISPDDRRIAVSLIDYNQSPPKLTLYVEDLSGANHIEIFSSTDLYVWPVGWHAGKLVVAVGDAYPNTQPSTEPAHPWCLPSLGPCVADNPYAAVHGFHLVDPSNGNRIATLGSDRCQVIGLLTTAGTICREGEFPGGTVQQVPFCQPTFTACLRLADWHGIINDWIQIATIWIGAMTPDGSRITTCCNFDSIEVYPRAGSGVAATRLTPAAAPQGWLDDDYLMVQPIRMDPNVAPQNAIIRSVGSGSAVTVSVPGVPVALLPGGF